jgi:hypothetical protein
MLSRALSLATVMLLIGCFSSKPAQAQATNLEAGKAPSQIFAGTCTACHKSPRGLLKTIAPGSLQGFLRQHYTTSPDMASSLSAYLISNGATDTRYGGGAAKPDKDAKSEARPGGSPEQLDRQGRRIRTAPPQDAAPQQAARPDADGLSQGEPGHLGRRRPVRPGEAPETGKPTTERQAPAAAAERGPDGRKLTAKQRLMGKRGKPAVEEPPKADMEPANGGPVTDEKPAGEIARDGGSKPESAKPSGEAKSEPANSEPAKPEGAKSDVPKETGDQAPALRADPVPPVTSAPPASAAASGAAPERSPPASSVVAAPAAAAVPPAAASSPAAASAPSAVTASTPQPEPATPASPPTAPISK